MRDAALSSRLTARHLGLGSCHGLWHCSLRAAPRAPLLPLSLTQASPLCSRTKADPPQAARMHSVAVSPPPYGTVLSHPHQLLIEGRGTMRPCSPFRQAANDTARGAERARLCATALLIAAPARLMYSRSDQMQPLMHAPGWMRWHPQPKDVASGKRHRQREAGRPCSAPPPSSIRSKVPAGCLRGTCMLPASCPSALLL